MPELMRLIGDDRVDVVTLNNASPVLRQAVITDGVVVKEEKILRTSFEEQATCEYLDTAHLRATHDAAVKRRLARGAALQCVSQHVEIVEIVRVGFLRRN